MRLRPYGDRALLLDCDDLAEAQAWFAALHGTTEAVLGARSVLVRGEPAVLRTLVERTTPLAAGPGADDRAVEVPVAYDGPDLDDVARLTGLSTREVVAAHTGTAWTVAFGGFAPGFSYLVGGDPRLEVPRRPSPRTTVPAGSVGLAGGFSGVYPRSSPGGWQLVGRTSLAMWDSRREPPALLTAGTTVRFVVA
ncbi:5-oxoprolinase subunit PxpB [Aeromicrobium chenweiae]|uniref:Allophanate hydrolase n=1 Tax=Aeromicrobium chenweiae TaxID=2079793 RepID=A0A2S0WPT7_9ACTN|nr:5-oxoprolinase subunit PxpB [Aeromicrobium chenweiae]AWB93337.1 allophanate hydrolase [Aeromicrobium chenweiae]TGN34327.1 5-oxoprolinase subunit PxpB [Aeromicrobium chenweiae]